MEYINEKELIKLLDILREKNISHKIVFNLCKVNHFFELTKVQYNNLLFLLCEVNCVKTD